MRRYRSLLAAGTIAGLLITMPVSVAQAATAAPGGRILFAYADTSGYGSLRSVRPNGTSMYVYSQSSAWWAYPDYSPDGTRIAYVYEYGIHTMSAVDGSDDRALDGVPCGPASPRWSPDGKWVAMESCSDIYAASSDGLTVRNLTQSDFNDLQMAWAPGGRRFATATYPGVQVYRADGTWLRTPTDLPAAWHLDWNPDGRSIAVEAAGDLWLVDAATGSTRRLTDTPGITESSPVWSPDGRWLSYGSGPDDPTAPDPNSAAIDPQIWLMTRAGAQRHSTGVHGVPTSWRAAP